MVLYRDDKRIVRARSLWQHTRDGAAWTVRDVADGMVHAESVDGRVSVRFPLAELLGDYTEI